MGINNNFPLSNSTNYFDFSNSTFANTANLTLSCEKLEDIWNVATASLPQPWNCQGNLCETNPILPFHTRMVFEKLSDRECLVNLDSRDSALTMNFAVNMDRLIFEARNKHQGGDFFKASSNLENNFKAEWQQTSFDFDKFVKNLEEGKIHHISDYEYTSNGYFNITKDPNSDKITLDFKNGEQSLTGECDLGVNTLTCKTYDENNFLSKAFGLHNKVIVNYSKTDLKNGKELYQLDFSTPSFLIFSGKQLGHFEVVVDSDQEFEGFVNIASLDSNNAKPLLKGKFYCKDKICEESFALNHNGFSSEAQLNAYDLPQRKGVAYSTKTTTPSHVQNRKDVTIGQELFANCNFNTTSKSEITECEAGARAYQNESDLFDFKGNYRSDVSPTSKTYEGSLVDVVNKKSMEAEASHKEEPTANLYNFQTKLPDGSKLTINFEQPKPEPKPEEQ